MLYDRFWTNAPIWQSVSHCFSSDHERSSKPVGDDCLWYPSNKPVCFLRSIRRTLQLLENPLWCSIPRRFPGQSTISFDHVCPISQFTSDWSSRRRHTIIFYFSFPSWTGSFHGCPCGEESIRFTNYLSHDYQSATTPKIPECCWELWTHTLYMCIFLQN